MTRLGRLGEGLPQSFKETQQLSLAGDKVLKNPKANLVPTYVLFPATKVFMVTWIKHDSHIEINRDSLKYYQKNQKAKDEVITGLVFRKP